MSEHLGASACAVLPFAHWMDGGWGVGWGIAMMAAMILFWGALIVGAVWLVRYLVRERDRSSFGDRGSSALQVLERRFAAGEIDADEYRERRSTLEGGMARDSE